MTKNIHKLTTKDLKEIFDEQPEVLALLGFFNGLELMLDDVMVCSGLDEVPEQETEQLGILLLMEYRHKLERLTLLPHELVYGAFRNWRHYLSNGDDFGYKPENCKYWQVSDDDKPWGRHDD